WWEVRWCVSVCVSALGGGRFPSMLLQHSCTLVDQEPENCPWCSAVALSASVIPSDIAVAKAASLGADRRRGTHRRTAQRVLWILLSAAPVDSSRRSATLALLQILQLLGPLDSPARSPATEHQSEDQPTLCTSPPYRLRRCT